jgi:hypothetical protein
VTQSYLFFKPVGLVQEMCTWARCMYVYTHVNVAGTCTAVHARKRCTLSCSLRSVQVYRVLYSCTRYYDLYRLYVYMYY